MKAYIFGLEHSVQDAGFLSVEDLNQRVGQNTGNLAFHYAIARQIEARCVVPWSASDDDMRSAGDVAVIPCANQVGEHLDMDGSAKKLAAMSSKVVAIGLGAQSGIRMEVPRVPEGTVRWIREMVRHAPVEGVPNIAVRGEFSMDVLSRLGFSDHAVVTGCPTLFINPSRNLGRDLAVAIKPFKRICVVAGHYRWSHLARMEASLCKMVESSGGGYVVQSPVEMIRAAVGQASLVDPVEFEKMRNFSCPHLDREQFLNWVHRHYLAFFDVSSWMSYYRKFDLVVGARIHGVMLALQAGVPGLCIAHDSRTVELCKTMRVPFVESSKVSQGISRDLLGDLWEFNSSDFDSNRLMLAKRYSSFLQANGLSVSGDLLSLAA